VTRVTAQAARKGENIADGEVQLMTVLLMVLLALLVFGLVGILLTAQGVGENWKRSGERKVNAVSHVSSNAVSSIKPKV